MEYRLGIDLGSSYTKGALVNESNQLVDSFCVKTGYSFSLSSNRIIEAFSKNYQISYPLYTCGYGRELHGADYVSNSEIIALSRAIFSIYKQRCSVIDIGGQDTKFIKINEKGQVEKFKMNRKCAAGTGSFIEEIAFRLDIPPLEFNSIVSEATGEVKINSFCTVFAVSEIVGLIKNGNQLPNIILGIYNSIISRCLEMIHVDDFLILTGGLVEKHPVLVDLFKKVFPNTVCPENPQILAAYGCVLLNQANKLKQN